jgi:hypothetical protein
MQSEAIDLLIAFATRGDRFESCCFWAGDRLACYRGKFGFAIIIAKEELEPWDPKVKEASQKVGGRLAISTTTTKVCA